MQDPEPPLLGATLGLLTTGVDSRAGSQCEAEGADVVGSKQNEHAEGFEVLQLPWCKALQIMLHQDQVFWIATSAAPSSNKQGETLTDFIAAIVPK